MTFQRKNAPPDSMLALGTPSEWTHGYETDVVSHYEFWEQQAITPTFDFPPDLATDFRDSLDEAKAGAASFANHHRQPDALATRNGALSILGMSLLARSDTLFASSKPNLEKPSAFGLKLNNSTSKPEGIVLHDLGEDDSGMPTRYLFHVSTSTADEYFPLDNHPDQWFQAGDLWVHRTSVKPSIWLIERLIAQDRTANFSHTTALVPYITARTSAT